MFTQVYWPQDAIASALGRLGWWNYDATEPFNYCAWVEGPSYSVRLWVWEMPEE